MLKEILIKDVSVLKDQLIRMIFDSYTYKVDNICTHLHHLRYIKDVLETVDIVPVVDFPNGLLSPKQKAKEIKTIEFYQYKNIDYCVNNFLLSNSLLKDLDDEIKTLKSVSTCGNVRPIIEYSSLYDTSIVESFLKICKNNGIETVVLSTTDKSDNILDDRIFCVLVQNFGMKCIVSNKYFNKEKILKIKESDPYGIRSLSISSFSDNVYNLK